MANPLVYKGDGVIQIMSTAELNNLSQVVLEYIASNDGPGGIYTSNTGNASFTLIGTFTDTKYQGDIGGGDVSILSTEYNLYQDLQPPTGTDAPKPIVWNSNTAPLQVMTETQANTLADLILSYGVSSEGPHSYVLANTTPSDGGTWVSLGQLKDVFTGNTETSVFLYKKLNMGTPKTLFRPLKSDGSGTLQRFSDAEINQIAKRVRDRIVSTGVGQYLFQEATPVGGTWVSKGTIVDTRPTISPQEYGLSSYGASYTGQESSVYQMVEPAVYSDSGTGGGYYTQDETYTGLQDETYTGATTNYTGITGSDYTGTVSSSYTTSTGVTFDGASFTGTVYTSTFNSYYVSTPFTAFSAPSFTTFTGTTPANFTGTTPANFSAPATPTVYTGTTPSNFSGPANTYFSGPATPTAYTGITPANFSGPGNTYFSGVGADVVYTGSTFYTGLSAEYISVSPAVTYYSGQALFTGAPTPGQTGFYAVDFIGPPGSTYYVVSSYTGTLAYYVGPASYGGPTAVFYTGDTGGTFAGTPNILYTGPGVPTTYTGTTTVTYTGGSNAFFTGFVPGTVYTGTTTTTYTGTTSTFFTGFVPGTVYTGVTPITYTGSSPSTYTGAASLYYTGITTTNYIGSFNSFFSTSYTATFTGSTNAYYTSSQEVAFGGSQFAAFAQTLYTGTADAPYTLSPIYTGVATQYYTGVSPVDYTGLIDVNYDASYATTYTGSVINTPEQTISTRTLWRRIA